MQTKPFLSFEAGTNTIRQLPQNYMIAFWYYNRWIIDADSAAEVELVVKVAKATMLYENKFQKDGEKLVESIVASDKVNEVSNFRKSVDTLFDDAKKFFNVKSNQTT